LLTIPLNFDCSYVDADLLFVVFIIDTTHSSFIRCGLSTLQRGLALSVLLRGVAGAGLLKLLPRSLALGYPLHNLSNGPCIRLECAALSRGYGSACKIGSRSCNHLHCKKQKTQGVYRDIGPNCVSGWVEGCIEQGVGNSHVAPYNCGRRTTREVYGEVPMEPRRHDIGHMRPM